jgi:hypothetical protein
MSRSGNIVEDIKAAVNPADYDLNRAEGRADFDDALRAEIARRAPDDEKLRRHAGDMLGVWRRGLFEGRIGDE